MFFRIWIMMIGFLLISNIIFCIPSYVLDSEKNTQHSGSFQFISNGSQQVMLTKISPLLPLNNLEMLLDFNLFLQLHNEEVNRIDFPLLSINRVHYKASETYSFLLGNIHNLHFGSGLLVDHFNSGILNSPYTLRHLAMKAQYHHKNFNSTLFWSLENLYAVRFDYASQFTYPYTLGFNMVYDLDGVDYNFNNLNISRPSQLGYSVDLTFSITPDVLYLYTELGGLHHQGLGISSGMKGRLVSLFDYQIAFHRSFNGFVPRYFNHDYYSSSFNFDDHGLKEAKSGFEFSLDASIFPRKIRVGFDVLLFQNHQMSHTFLTWNSIQNSSGRIQLAIPFQGPAYKRFTFFTRYARTKHAIFIIFNNFFSSSENFSYISVGLDFDLDQLNNTFTKIFAR